MEAEVCVDSAAEQLFNSLCPCVQINEELFISTEQFKFLQEYKIIMKWDLYKGQWN